MMMLGLSESLNPLLDAHAKPVEQDQLDFEKDEDAAEMTLQLMPVDGEEAFTHWTDTDSTSIYGARSLPPSIPPH
jgi:hypothetical protein